jgi:RNA polymerase sigma-70 factor (ECF subfamily)
MRGNTNCVSVFKTTGLRQNLQFFYCRSISFDLSPNDGERENGLVGAEAARLAEAPAKPLEQPDEGLSVLRKAPHIRLVKDAREQAAAKEEGADRPVLAETARRKNVRALEGATKANHGLLVGWLGKKLGNPEDAADVAQDVYMRVYRFASVEVIENPQALLFKTAANLAINELKRRGRILRRQVQVDDDSVACTVADLPSEDPTPEEAMGQKQDIGGMMDAIRALPEKPRTAFVKNRFEDKTYAVIATEMGVSESTVEKYMMDALKRLRARLIRKSTATVLPLPRKGRRGRG